MILCPFIKWFTLAIWFMGLEIYLEDAIISNIKWHFTQRILTGCARFTNVQFFLIRIERFGLSPQCYCFLDPFQPKNVLTLLLFYFMPFLEYGKFLLILFVDWFTLLILYENVYMASNWIWLLPCKYSIVT